MSLGAHGVEWEQLDSRVVASYSAFSIRRNTARSPRTGQVQEFDVVARADCVQVLACADDGRLILVEQYRHGIQRVSLEFPAGILDAGEDPVAGALRELREETGYRAASGEVIGVLDMDPSIETSRVHIVHALNCVHSGEREEDEGEAIAVRLVHERDIDGLIRRGTLVHATAVAAWYLYRQR